MLAATPDIPVSDEALAVSDPAGAPEITSVNGTKINQIAASMARGPVEHVPHGEVQPDPASAPSTP